MDRRDPAQSQRPGYRDALTGLWNRRVFQEALAEALAREPEPAGTIAVYLVCLRNFKNVNDDEGFEAGDAALQVVARRLADSVGSDGFVARVGGDQFTVVLDPVADARDAAAAAALLVETVEAPLASFELPPSLRRLTGRSLPATVGAALSAPGLSAEDLWRRADEASYPAERGRGRGAGGPRAVLYGEDGAGGAGRCPESGSRGVPADERSCRQVVLEPAPPRSSVHATWQFPPASLPANIASSARSRSWRAVIPGPPTAHPIEQVIQTWRSSALIG